MSPVGDYLNFREFDCGYNLAAKTMLILELGSTIQINTHLKIHDGTNY